MRGVDRYNFGVKMKPTEKGYEGLKFIGCKR
jgi:hypothetical protein